MDDNSWDRLVDAIDVKFGISDHGRSTRPLEDRSDLTEKVHFIVFRQGDNDFKIERITGPAIIDRKSHYHRHAAGSANRFENIYDPNEISRKTNFYRKTGDDWEPVSPEDLALN